MNQEVDVKEVEGSPEFENEVKKNKAVMLVAEVSEVPSIDRVIDVKRYNDVIKLFRVTAIVMRFINNINRSLHGNKVVYGKPITANELQISRAMWIKANQLKLKDTCEFNNVIKQLNIFEDEKGILRVKGRLNNANVPWETKAPIVLDKNHRLTYLLVLYYHLKVYHNGVKQTLNELRALYWFKPAIHDHFYVIKNDH